MKKLSNLILLLALLSLVAATQGCGVINKLRAKDSLNEGVRDFNKGRYEEAEGKFRPRWRVAGMARSSSFTGASTAAEGKPKLWSPLPESY